MAQNGEKNEISARGYAHPEVLVSTDWVAEHLEDPDIRIAESNEDPLVYPSGHIPGAVEIDWTRDLNNPLQRDYIQGDFRAASRGSCQAVDGSALRDFWAGAVDGQVAGSHRNDRPRSPSE